MGKSFKKILIGSISAILCTSILIFAIESHSSLYQVFLGFILFVLPFAFLSSFFSKTGSFILVSFTIMVVFIVTKYLYNDFWLGVVLAAIIGFALYFFITIPAIKTMSIYKPFSSKNYLENSKQFHEKN